MKDSGQTKQPRICAIIPAYNAEATIGTVVRGALKHVPVVIVVDDGSTDNTTERAVEAGAEVTTLSRNRGKGNALKVLFKTAVDMGFDAAISIDADGQHDTEDLPRFIHEYRLHPNDLITGSRTLTATNMPRARYNAMQVARFYISLAANQFIDDTQCGFRLYPLEMIKRLPLVTEGYITEAEILIKAGDMGVGIRSVTIGAIYNNYVSHFSAVADGIAIGVYVAYYLMIKWFIEGLSSNTVLTYAPGRMHDLIGKNQFIYRLVQALCILFYLPSTLLYSAEYLFLPFLIKNNFASVRALNVSFLLITLASYMAPVLMVLSITDKLINTMGVRVRLVDRFIKAFYPYL